MARRSPLPPSEAAAFFLFGVRSNIPTIVFNNVGMLDLTPFKDAAFGDRLLRLLERYALPCDAERIETLRAHVIAVIEANDRLHLTSVRDADSFLERHLEESVLGATVLSADCSGPLIDLGSGNGYPGIPLAVLQRGLQPMLVEASEKKATFLSGLQQVSGLEHLEVLHRQVQRSSDLPSDLPPVKVLATRAMGNWERVLPRLYDRLSNDAQVLVWAGENAPNIFKRSIWKDRFELRTSLPLPGRDRARLWVLVKRPA